MNSALGFIRLKLLIYLRDAQFAAHYNGLIPEQIVLTSGEYKLHRVSFRGVLVVLKTNMPIWLFTPQ